MRPLEILIVDDDRDLADAIGEALEMVGHKPAVAYSGTEAIEKYCTQSFDITFMDVKLPDINGVETFLTIRKMDPSAQVIMMTGYRIDQLLAEATDNGAVKVLRKPFAIEEIIEPYLLQQGFIARTPRGRVLTGQAFEHLGVAAPPQAAQGTLFTGGEEE